MNVKENIFFTFDFIWGNKSFFQNFEFTWKRNFIFEFLWEIKMKVIILEFIWNKICDHLGFWRVNCTKSDEKLNSEFELGNCTYLPSAECGSLRLFRLFLSRPSFLFFRNYPVNLLKKWKTRKINLLFPFSSFFFSLFLFLFLLART